MSSEEKKVSESRNNTPSQEMTTSGTANWPPSILRLVAGAMIAAAISFVVLKTMYPIFVLPEDIAKVPEQAPIEVYQKHDKAQYEADGKNYSIVFVIAGSVFGVWCPLHFWAKIDQGPFSRIHLCRWVWCRRRFFEQLDV